MTRETFTTTESFVEEILEPLAEDFYGGNKSQCFRSAVLDHEQTLREGDLQQFLEILIEKEENQSDEIEEIKETVAEILDRLEYVGVQTPTVATDSTNEKPWEVANRILDVLSDNEVWWVEDIADELGISPVDAWRGIDKLETSGQVIREDTDDNPTKFRLA